MFIGSTMGDSQLVKVTDMTCHGVVQYDVLSTVKHYSS